nr:sterol regulatory element-binding protein cleavage-activating protein [Quercus suber]
MIWYLLYPLRGTSDPPRLAPEHPVRRAFYRHGKTTAQHWLVAMLVSVAIAMGCSYPSLLLSESPTAGLAAYPHHVWTTARPLDHNPGRTDVEMRQVWIYGSTDQALNKSVLKSALAIQQKLIGLEDMLPVASHDDQSKLNSLTWGYHSPLMYWNNSALAIDEDQDVLETIQSRSKNVSSLNVALRPASVFAGKKFDRWKLQAADALVITLMNRVENGAGEDWESRMISLSTDACKDCTMYPANGHITRARVYEFSFTPLNWKENLFLAFAYSCMVVYVFLSLRRLKAFHSRLGLIVTAVTAMTFSILSSITVCDILKINLSMVPRNAYPFVVLVIGLENMFRLINAILAYPATMATDQRIANALGDIGPVSVATVIQNLLILSVLSRFVSPGVAAFCAFACIATLFDLFFLLSFFVAVLNVDIRRLELQDALARSSPKSTKRRSSPSQSSWFDALVKGRLPFSTRMAGTAVTTTFILSLNYHFFERHEQVGGIRYLLSFVRGSGSSVAEFDSFTSPPMNATLTPGEWMRMQDFETARDVMRLAKPGADSFVVRLFTPLIVVLPGADRSEAPLTAETWTKALRAFAIHHFFPVAVAVVFGVTFVAVLMNFLLYSENDDIGSMDNERTDTLTVQSLAMPHKLDIIKLCGTDRGHFISIGLDRTIAISTFDWIQQVRQTMPLSSDALSQISWPIYSAMLDENAEWMACHCADDCVYLYSCTRGAIFKVVKYPDDHPPILFKFVRLLHDETVQTRLIVLTSGGRLLMSDLESDHSDCRELSPLPLVGAALFEVSSQERRLVIATETARLVAYNWTAGSWLETGSQTILVPHEAISSGIRIDPHPGLETSILIIKTTAAILFVDNQSLATIAKLSLDPVRDPSGPVIIGPVTECPSCGSVALGCIAVASCQDDANELELVTWTASNDVNDADAPATICLRKSTSSCISLDHVRRESHKLPHGGAWHALKSYAVLGLRKRQSLGTNTNVSTKAKTGASAQLRHRRHSRGTAPPTAAHEWEAYRISLEGEVLSVDSPATLESEDAQDVGLYVNHAGPAVPLDPQSVVVAFGNRVQIISHSGSRRSTAPSLLERKTSTSRRRVSARKGQ